MTAVAPAGPGPDDGAEGASQAARRVVRNSALLILQPLLLNLLSIAVTGYIARRLGADDFGRFTYAFSISPLFASLAGLGLGAVTVRDLVRGDVLPPARYLGRTLGLRLGAGLLAYSLLLLLVLGGGLLHEAGWVLLLAGTTIFASLLTITIEDYFRSREEMQLVARVRLLAGLILTGSSLLVVGLGGRLAALVVLYVAGAYLTLLLAGLTLVRRYFWPVPGFDLAFTRRVLRQGVIFYAGGLLGSLAQRVDRLLLERLQGATALGHFGAGSTLVEKLLVLPEGLAAAVYPALTGLVHLHPQAAGPALGRFLTLAAMVGLPTALGTTLLARPLVGLIFGPGYEEAVLVLAFGVWVVPAWCLGQVLSSALAARGRERQGLAVTLVGLCLSILGNALTIPRYGPPGSALTLAATGWLSAALLFVLARRHYGPVLDGAALGRIGVALALLGVGVGLTRDLPLPIPILLGIGLYALPLRSAIRDLWTRTTRSGMTGERS